MTCKWVVYGGLVFGLLGGNVDGADKSFKGYAVGDYYYVVSGADKEENGFQFRRIYFTMDLKWNDRWSGRFRLESKNAGFGSNETMTPFVKDAYLKYKRNGKTLVLGQSPTPTWDFAETVWGYRSVSKTIIDLNKVGSSRDTGVRFTTPIGEKAVFDVMLGNGNSTRAEGNYEKKAYGRLHLRPSKSAGALFYVDWEKRPGGQDRTTLKGFLYRKKKQNAFGLEGFVQRRNGTPDVNLIGISAFGRAKTSSNVGLFGRVDFFDPNDKVSDDRMLVFVGGVDTEPTSGVHLMPNVLLRSFEDSALDAEFIPRMTLFYIF